jgi:hypothetical protein
VLPVVFAAESEPSPVHEASANAAGDDKIASADTAAKESLVVVFIVKFHPYISNFRASTCLLLHDPNMNKAALSCAAATV